MRIASRINEPGFAPQRLMMTSCWTPKKYPAEEVVGIYHERWEIELGF